MNESREVYIWIGTEAGVFGPQPSLGMGNSYNTAWVDWHSIQSQVRLRWNFNMPDLWELRWLPDCFRPPLPYSPNFVGAVEYAPVFAKDGALAGCVFRYAGGT